MWLKNALRRIGAALVAAVCFVVWSGPAAAGGLQSILEGIGGDSAGAYTASPNRYQAAGRHIFSSGGFSVRVSTSGRAPTLISITPPSMPTAGCGGVSAHFGGFSFISGAQIEQWVRTISQGAVGFVVNLAIKALCPICEAVLSLMQRLAQAASALAMDGCRAGEALARMGSDFIKSGSSSTTKCGVAVSSTGIGADYLGSVDTLCSTVGDAMGRINEYKETFLGAGASREQASMVNAELGMGNQTWHALTAMGVDRGASDTDTQQNFHRLIIMSLTGAAVVAPRGAAGPVCTAAGAHSATGASSGTTGTGSTSTGGATSASGNDGHPACYYSPITNSRTLWAVYLCGWDSANSTIMGSAMEGQGDRVKQYCANLLSQVTASVRETGGDGSLAVPTVWKCANNEYRECLQLEAVPISDLGIEIPGYYPAVTKVLQDAVQRVASGQAPSDDFLRLVESTDLPVYQALNVAAVYPAAASALLDSMALLIAQSLASGQLNAVASRLGYAGAYKGQSGEHLNMDAIIKALEDMNAFAGAILTETGATVDLHMQLHAQIMDINRRVQQNVISGELLTSERLASKLRHAATANDKAAAGNAATGGGAQ